MPKCSLYHTFLIKRIKTNGSEGLFLRYRLCNIDRFVWKTQFSALKRKLHIEFGDKILEDSSKIMLVYKNRKNGVMGLVFLLNNKIGKFQTHSIEKLTLISALIFE